MMVNEKTGAKTKQNIDEKKWFTSTVQLTKQELVTKITTNTSKMTNHLEKLDIHYRNSKKIKNKCLEENGIFLNCDYAQNFQYLSKINNQQSIIKMLHCSQIVTQQ